MRGYVNECTQECVSMWTHGCVSACVIKLSKQVCVCVCIGLMGKRLTHRQVAIPMLQVEHNCYWNRHLLSGWGSVGCGEGRVFAEVVDA